MDKLFKTNITLQELEDLVKFAKEHGESPHKTVTLSFRDSGIGTVITVAKDWDSPSVDVTAYESW